MWRDTGRPVRVVFLDARACLPLLVFVVYWSWATFYIAATGVIVTGGCGDSGSENKFRKSQTSKGQRARALQ